ncbi:MAG: DUF58 domain-containing protein [Saprospiraceae bacterium]
METSELLKKVRKIEIKTKGLSKHIFSGEYHSAFKGRGMSFSEVRNYQYGDDVRSIDWNVTARYGETFIKVFEEERELTVMLLIDISKSAFFGTKNQLKSEMITEICAVLAFSAINNNDKVGVIFFTDKIEKYIPPKKGKKHILLIIRELLGLEATSGSTDLGVALRFLNNIQKKKSTTFILSDFIADGYEEALRIASKRHDLIGMHIHDIRERELPNVGLIRAIDAETGKMIWVDTSSKKLRARYQAHFDQHFDYFNQTFRKAGLDVMSVRTDESYIHSLQKLFKSRKK